MTHESLWRKITKPHSISTLGFCESVNTKFVYLSFLFWSCIAFIFSEWGRGRERERGHCNCEMIKPHWTETFVIYTVTTIISFPFFFLNESTDKGYYLFKCLCNVQNFQKCQWTHCRLPLSSKLYSSHARTLCNLHTVEFLTMLIIFVQSDLHSM